METPLSRDKTLPGPSAEPLPDDAVVVRCGRPPFDDPTPLRQRCDWHEGHFGFSVQCGAGVFLEELSRWCPNRKIGVTTVGAVRVLGYDVIVTSGKGHHATVAVSPDWTHEDSRRLVDLFREQVNPSQRMAR